MLSVIVPVCDRERCPTSALGAGVLHKRLVGRVGGFEIKSPADWRVARHADPDLRPESAGADTGQGGSR